MYKRKLFYFTVFIVLSLLLFFLNRTYREIIAYSDISNRHDAVHGYYQSLSKEINNLAIINPTIVKASKSAKVQSLFFADSTSITQQLFLLKSVVRDTVNVEIAYKLDSIIKQELSWLMNNNILDSLNHHNSDVHIAALKNIDSLIGQGIHRTDFLFDSCKVQLNENIGKVRKLTIAFILLMGMLIIYTAVNLYWQRSKRKQTEKDLEIFINRINDSVVFVDKDWRYTFINDSAMVNHQLGRKKTLGKVLWEVHPEMKGTVFYDAYQKAMNDGREVEVESYYAPMDKWFFAKGYPSDKGLTIFYQDITNSKKISEQLIKSEEKYRTLFLKSPLPTWIYNYETLRFIDVNEAAVKHYGYSVEEFLAMTIKDIRPQEDVEALLEDITKIPHDYTGSRSGNWRHIKKDGEIIIVETTAHSFNQYNTQVRIVIVSDITEKIKAEQELIQSQMRLSEAQAIAHIGNWDIDLEKDMHTWSDEVYKIYGLNKTGTIPSIELFLSFIHPDDRIIAEELLKDALQNFTESKIDFRLLPKAGKKRYGHIEWRFEFNKDQTPVRLFGILQDITERRESAENLILLEKKLQEQRIQGQKKISRAIIKAQEQQRNHIGQELHDNINQILFGTKFHLSIAGRKDKNVKELIEYPMQLIDNSMEEIRLLCHNLVTPLKNIQLQDLVQDLINKHNYSTDALPRINFKYEVFDEVSDDLKLNIYRIIQEQINNILKHAEAKNVNISICIVGQSIYISVQDDGKGYDVESKRKGIGISNMMNRVETFNGKVKIESGPAEGSKTEITIPYKTKKEYS